MGSETIHEELARLLAEVVRSGDNPQEVARRSRRREDDDAGRVGDLDDLFEMLVAVGRVPHHASDSSVGEPVDVEAGIDREIVLGRCCYESAATVAPTPVCGLHRGLLERNLDGTRLSVTALEPGDPCRAGCRVRVRLCASS